MRRADSGTGRNAWLTCAGSRWSNPVVDANGTANHIIMRCDYFSKEAIRKHNHIFK